MMWLGPLYIFFKNLQICKCKPGICALSAFCEKKIFFLNKETLNERRKVPRIKYKLMSGYLIKKRKISLFFFKMRVYCLLVGVWQTERQLELFLGLKKCCFKSALTFSQEMPGHTRPRWRRRWHSRTAWWRRNSGRWETAPSWAQHKSVDKSGLSFAQETQMSRILTCNMNPFCHRALISCIQSIFPSEVNWNSAKFISCF